MEVLKQFEGDIKKILQYHYKKDDSFPRSCGSVSMVLLYVLENSKLKDEYNISYKRGHFKNELEQEDCFCDESIIDFSFDIKRGDDLTNFCCIGCNSCDYMVNHSWIEIENKKDKKITILDFTSIQFEEDFYEYNNELLENDFNEDELYEYLKERSKFIINEKDKEFNNYLVSEKEYSGEQILEIVDNLLKEKDDSELTLLLKELDYLS